MNGNLTGVAAGPKASIVIPTFRRSRSLRRALLSCQAQIGFSPGEFEVVVVDNCSQRSAQAVVDEISALSPVEVNYENEPIPGVSATRNRGIARARGELIVFLDDDEEAEPGWLAALVAAQRVSGCDAVFGAVLGQCDGRLQGHVGLAEKEMTRLFPEPAGPMPARRIAKLGSGNSLFRRDCFTGPEPFDLSLGLSGGEDSALIRKLVADGRQFTWCPEARVKEFISEERQTLRYLLKRRFSCGQIRTSLCVMPGYSNTAEALFWMMVGVVQVSVGTLLALATSVVKPESARRYLCMVCGGLGKVLWMAPFRVQRYTQ